ncbi:two-component sensor histidine kinase [Clostridia bacterium]|nr:two-component sensor histidine kinase [Clostridia bacterium]
MNTVFAKHYTWLLALIFVTVLLMGMSFMLASGTYIASERMRKLERNAEAATDVISAYIDPNGFLSLQYKGWMTAASEIMEAHILLCDENGVVLMCSDDFFCNLHVGKTLPAELTEEVMSDGEFSEHSDLNGIYDALHDVEARAVYNEDGAAVGYVTVSMPTAGNKVLIIAFIRIFMVISVLVLLVAFVSAYLVSKKLTRPLKAISNSTRSYASGDFTPRVQVDCNAHDEVSQLCANFNAMADALQQLEGLRREFIANVSHELRTPMTVITGYVDGIMDGTIPPDDRPRYMTIISEEVRRLSRLVARMLEVTQIQSGQIAYTLRPVNLCEIVRRVILGFESRIDAKSMEVECELPEQDVNVLFDPDALTQVLTNLTDNAIKFTPPGGLLKLSVTYKGHRAQIAVSNSGSEIPAADLPFVFDRFHKADKSRAEDRVGLGLGLYIVKNILGGHKEDIRVTSEKGITSFTFGVNLAK